MTLDMAIKRACFYADAKDVSKALLCHYADMAQKELAILVVPVIKRFNVSKKTSVEESYPLPENFIGIHKVIRRASAIPVKWRVEKDKLLIADYGAIDIYYKALPDTISQHTNDDYVFQIGHQAHTAIPYYMAHHIAADYEVATICLEEWNKIKKLLLMSQPKEKLYIDYIGRKERSYGKIDVWL